MDYRKKSSDVRIGHEQLLFLYRTYFVGAGIVVKGKQILWYSTGQHGTHGCYVERNTPFHYSYF